MSSATIPNPVLVVAGPTASGKSALAIDAAREFDGVVINGDSMQVYRDLRILTARPDPADEARAPHRLFGVLDAAEVCSAGRWLAMAVDEIAAARDGGKLPIVVGGTGLYLKALLEGLAPVPEVAADLRRETRDLHARLGGEAFRAALAEIDAEAAAALPAGDGQRLIRAYEVAKGTGRTLAEWQGEPPAEPALDAAFAVVVLAPPRDTLYAAVDARFREMVDQGAVAEAATLVARGLDMGLPAMKAVGVRELAASSDGTVSLEDAIAAGQKATRNYAKRQLTWLRNQMPTGEVFVAQYSESLKPKIFSLIRQFLLTGPM
jgi:tRNA dimethylallyltransferase